MGRIGDEDLVSRLVGHCMEGREKAQELFDSLIAGRKRRLSLEGEEVELTEDEAAEFVQRYSAEVEPVFWESKRRKN